MSHPAVQAFLGALENAAQLLESGHLEASVTAMGAVDVARDAAQAAKVSFSPAELQRARSLETRCHQAWGELQQALVGQLQQTGTTRRALGAYGAHGGRVRVE